MKNMIMRWLFCRRQGHTLDGNVRGKDVCCVCRKEFPRFVSVLTP